MFDDFFAQEIVLILLRFAGTFHLTLVCLRETKLGESPPPASDLWLEVYGVWIVLYGDLFLMYLLPKTQYPNPWALISCI